MKKFTRRLFLGMLILTMLLSMTACGGKKTEEEDKKETAQTEDQKDDATESAETEAEPVETEPAETEDYGKTTADADGIISFDVLKEGFDWLEYQTSSEGGYQRPTYEEIAEKFGANAHKTHPDSWEDDYHVYEWITSGGDFLVVSFKVQADGSETWNSSSWSNSLND